MTNLILKSIRAAGFALILGPLLFLLINWINGGIWGNRSLGVLAFLSICALVGGFEKAEEDANATGSRLGKGILYGFLAFLAASAIVKAFALPFWAFMIGAGISCLIASTTATHNPEKP